MRVTADRDLAVVRQAAKDSISAKAETIRKRYITPGDGKAMVYMRKADEARRVLADNNPKEIDYPLLSAEVGITAPTLMAVAQVVNAQERLWLKVAALIEAAEQRAKKAVDACPPDVAHIERQAQIDWDSVISSITSQR